jgi:predicted amidohydrolase
MTAFRAAAVQLRSGLDIARNIAAAEALIREAAKAGAGYVLTPEMTNVLDRDRDRLLKAIKGEDREPSLARFRALAGELGIHLHIGSLAIRIGEGAVANRSFLIGPDGAVTARYDKIHMFDVDLPNGETYRESALYKAGGAAAIAELPWTRLGMTVCYDVRFPHLYRALAHAGATIIAIPAAFTRTTGEAHWHVLVRARAIETGAYVVAAAQGGAHEDGRQTYGHSMIVDPWGRVLAEAGTEPGVIVADIDPEMSAAVRKRVPSLANDRPFVAPGPTPPRLKSVS